jgi:hypothetical protein
LPPACSDYHSLSTVLMVSRDGRGRLLNVRLLQTVTAVLHVPRYRNSDVPLCDTCFFASATRAAMGQVQSKPANVLSSLLVCISVLVGLARIVIPPFTTVCLDVFGEAPLVGA